MRLTRDELRILWRTRPPSPSQPATRPMTRAQRKTAIGLCRKGLVEPAGEDRDNFTYTPAGAAILRRLKKYPQRGLGGTGKASA